MILDLDSDYYEAFREDVISRKKFDNNVTCWRILTSDMEGKGISERQDLLLNALRLISNDWRESYSDLLIYLEYLNWKNYLSRIYEFLKTGIQLNVLGPKTTIAELQIESFQPKMENYPFFVYRNSLNCYERVKAISGFDYNKNFNRLNLLDIALILESKEQALAAIELGVKDYIEDTYYIPQLSTESEQSYGLYYFTIRRITTKINYENYTRQNADFKRAPSNNDSPDEEMYNILTRRYVKGPYYINDFYDDID